MLCARARVRLVCARVLVCVCVRVPCVRVTPRRKFTDVSARDGSFRLQCLVCSTGLRDVRHAEAHAAETGHVEFGQVASVDGK